MFISETIILILVAITYYITPPIYCHPHHHHHSHCHSL